jgi:hypothetical protein
VLAHHIHVRQQSASGPAASRETAEQQADTAAVAALAGGPIPAVGAAEGPLYFEAHWHQASLTGAMHQLGFSDQEAEDAYFGNWCRDLSQFLVPMAATTIGPQASFSLVNLLAMHHFGHGVTPAELGVYDPHQHIDNPAGTTDRDVLPSGVTIEGYGDQGHAAGPEDPTSLDPAYIRDQFAVSAAGVPAYMEASRQLVEHEALTAISLGRTREGMLHVGNFSHTMEDLFAHSNWVEIAVGRVVSEHVDLIPAGETRDDVQSRIDEHRPPIENYAADVAGVGGAARPILSTGTFSGGGAGNDTLISIKAEAQNLLRDREPFKEDGGGGEMYDFAIEVLQHAQESADEGVLGPMFTAVVEQAITNLGSLALGQLDALPGRARSALGDNVFGDIAAGAAELLSEGADAASQWAGDAWRSGLRDQLSSVVNGLGGAIGFAEMLVYLKGEANAIADAWKGLKDWVRELPEMLKEAILPQLVAAEREFKRQLRALLNAAYGRAVEVLIDELEGISPIVDAAETNVGVKEQHMRETLERELKPQMIAILTEVGGEEGARLAGQINAMTAEDVAAFASSDAFHRILEGLVADVGARARLQSSADSLSDTQNTVNQLGAVPDWAKAGASHSQTAKDHDDTALFGIAFACAQQADHMVLSDLQAAWMERGFIGPGAGMEGNFDSTPTGNEAEDARRQAFLKTRADGDYVVQHGRAENQDIGPRMAELAGAVEAIIHATPLLDPVLGGLAAVMRGNPTADAVRAELEATRARWETAARSGRFDDDVMAAVDRAVGSVARVLGTVGQTRRATTTTSTPTTPPSTTTTRARRRTRGTTTAAAARSRSAIRWTGWTPTAGRTPSHRTRASAPTAPIRPPSRSSRRSGCSSTTRTRTTGGTSSS